MKIQLWLLMAATALGCGGGDDDGAAGDGGPEQVDGGGDGDGGTELPRWDTLDMIPSGPVQETAVVELDGLIYVVGGIHGQRGTVADVLIYDPSDDSWQSGPDLPEDVHHANLAVVDGTLYVAGSLNSGFGGNSEVWSWTPGDEVWQSGTAMTGTVRGAAAVGVVGGRIIVAGGFSSSSVADASAYDPVLDEWDEDIADLPVALDHASGQTIDGTLYVIGGRTGGISNVSAATYEYDADGNQWIERAPMPTPRGGFGAGVVDGTIIVVGGEGNSDLDSGVYPDVEQYDPATNTWNGLSNMKTPRHGMGAAGLDGRLYVPGGATVQGFGSVATHEVLVLR